MASKAVFSMYGKSFDIDSVSFNFRRNVEPSGRVAGLVMGGELNISISTDSADTASILTDMMKEANQKGTDGKIVFYEAADSTKEMKTIKITGGFIYSFSEAYSMGQLMQIQISISCHQIDIGSIVHKNHWPGDPA